MKKKNPNSITLRTKCDKLITKFYSGKPCIICYQQTGVLNKYMTCGHHIVNRSLCAALRHDTRNIIPLCPTHHKFSNTLAAHSTYQPAQTAFVEWLKENYEVGYELLMTYKQIQKTKTYQELAEELTELLK